MSQVEVGIVSYTVSADYIASVGADFDSEGVDDAVLAQLNTLVPAGVVVHRNGKAFAEEQVAEEARAIDWDALLERIDVEQILAEHPRRCPPPSRLRTTCLGRPAEGELLTEARRRRKRVLADWSHDSNSRRQGRVGRPWAPHPLLRP